jgi:hypothetical protein
VGEQAKQERLRFIHRTDAMPRVGLDNSQDSTACSCSSTMGGAAYPAADPKSTSAHHESFINFPPLRSKLSLNSSHYVL